MNFEQTIQTNPLILMEGAIIERLRHNQTIQLHPRLVIAPLVGNPAGRGALTALYREYIAIAKGAGLPVVLSTPTWRANRERILRENPEANLNADAVQFMLNFKQEYPNLFIGGQIGCKNDCYKPGEALSRTEAFDFHSWQIQHLTEADFLYAVTLPEVDEALGMAQAMAATDRPYIISFVIGRSGRVLDGTPLEEAMHRIDAESGRPPLGYGVNCCYPSFLQAARLSEKAAKRMVSIQANASSLDHAQLDQSGTVHADDLEDWGDRMLELHRALGIKILGGCCGTDATHLGYLARTIQL